MLETYLRLNFNTTASEASAKGLSSSSLSAGEFRLEFRLPDVYGVYTFQVDYKRSGLTYLLEKDIYPVKPFRHNEYVRFVFQAYPYYINVWILLFISAVVIPFIWIATSENQAIEDKKKLQ